jgi:hypothetical protein
MKVARIGAAVMTRHFDSAANGAPAALALASANRGTSSRADRR